MWLFCFALALGFLVKTTRDPEENLHNITSKRVQFRCIKLVTVTIWSVVTQAAECSKDWKLVTKS